MLLSVQARAAVAELRSRAAEFVALIQTKDCCPEEVKGAVRAVSFDLRRLSDALLSDDPDVALRGANSLVGVNKGIVDTVTFWKIQDVRNAGSELSNLAIKVAAILTSERGGLL